MHIRLVPHAHKGDDMNGKDAAGIGIGAGAAIGIGLVGYGIYSATKQLPSVLSGCTSANGCAGAMKACTAQLQALSLQYTALMKEYVQYDAEHNLEMSQEQITNLHDIILQEQYVTEHCIGPIVKKYNLNFMEVLGAIIPGIVIIAIVSILGKSAYSYIKSKYKKPPKSPPEGGNYIFDATTAWLVQSGQIPATWYAASGSQYGEATVNLGVSTFKGISSAYFDELATIGILSAALAASVIATESATIAAEGAETIIIISAAAAA